MEKEKKSKDSYWFTHDSNASNDPKLEALIINHGFEGYGRWWRMVEYLRDQSEYKYDVSTKFAYSSLAKILNMTVSEAMQFVKDLIEEYLLLKTDEKYIWSESLIERMLVWDNKKETLKERGARGAQARWEREEAKKKAEAAAATKLETIITYSAAYNKLLNIYKADSSITERQWNSYKNLIDWMHDNAKRVLSMKEPLTIKQYLALCEIYKTKAEFEIVKKTLTDMHNWKKISERISVNLTLRAWLKNGKAEDTQQTEESFAAKVLNNGK